MPMFIFISGYFQKDYSTFSDVKNRVITIAKRLVVPYVIWILIGVCRSCLSNIMIDHGIIIGGTGRYLRFVLRRQMYCGI